MSHNPRPILHPSKRHPLTGEPLRAVGVLPNGRIVWPILGGDDTVPPADQPPAAPERPEGVSESEWSALGDSGKQAIVRERERANAAERALAASRARPAPPKPKEDPKPEVKPEAKPKGKDDAPETPDFAALIQQAVEAAVKPFVEEREQTKAQAAAEKVQKAVTDAAKDRLHDATDALAQIDLTKVVNDQGQADEAKVKAELEDLIKRKPHLAKTTQRLAPPGIGGGAPATATDADRVKAALAHMQKTTGVRASSSTSNNH